MREPINNVVRQITSFLSGQSEIIAAYLFSSHARGTATALSDIDIAVLVDEDKCPDHPLGYDALLLSYLLDIGKNNVDLVILNNALAMPSFRVLRDRKLLADKNPNARVKFATIALLEYYDLLPVEAIFNKAAFGHG